MNLHPPTVERVKGVVKVMPPVLSMLISGLYLKHRWRNERQKSDCCSANTQSGWVYICAYIHTSCIGCINGLAQDCGNSSASALELQQFCTKPSIYKYAVVTPIHQHLSYCSLVLSHRYITPVPMICTYT